MQRTGHRPALRMISYAAILVATGMTLAVSPAPAHTASSLLNEGDPLPAAGPGHVVASLNNTAVNHVGGFALSLNSSGSSGTLSHIWGNAAGGAGDIIRTEGTFGTLVQTSYESFYGIDDSGSVAYSASGNGGPAGDFDSVWKDDTPIAVEGEPIPALPGLFWSFASRPGISADGIPYFVGGTRDTPGGTTQNRGLFSGLAPIPLLLGGDLVPNIPNILDTASTVSFDYRFSALTTHYIAEVQFVGSSTANNAIVIDGEGLMLGGTLVAEGSPIPAGVGGQGGENWDNFDYSGHTESGDWFFTGDTDGVVTADEIIVRNGTISLREGDVLDGETLSGAIEGAYMNADGDLAFIWDIQLDTFEALFLNDMLLLQEGDEVDLDGDGNVDPGAVVSGFTGISTLTLSDRDMDNNVQVYFTADVDTAGTSSTTDDIEGFYCIVVDLGTTAVEASSSPATADLLLANAPNPILYRTDFRFSLATDSRARMTIYDVAGRLVSTVVDTDLPAGEHAIRWNRQTVRGDLSAGGVYFYRLETADGVQTRKMVLTPIK